MWHQDFRSGNPIEQMRSMLPPGANECALQENQKMVKRSGGRRMNDPEVMERIARALEIIAEKATLMEYYIAEYVESVT